MERKIEIGDVVVNGRLYPEYLVKIHVLHVADDGVNFKGTVIESDVPEIETGYKDTWYSCVDYRIIIGSREDSYKGFKKGEILEYRPTDTSHSRYKIQVMSDQLVQSYVHATVIEIMDPLVGGKGGIECGMESKTFAAPYFTRDPYSELLTALDVLEKRHEV